MSTFQHLSVVIAMLLLSACTTVKRNGGETFVREVDFPAVGEVTTAFVGDHMVQKGRIVEEKVLIVHEPIDGALYDIPAKKYVMIGSDDKDCFYAADGVSRSGIADPVQALAVGRHEGADLRVVTIFGGASDYEGNFSQETHVSTKSNSFQQTLIYSGRIGDKINIGYREFSNNFARPAFDNDVEYDLSASNTVGYKGALLEIVEATNSSITFKLIRNFADHQAL